MELLTLIPDFKAMGIEWATFSMFAMLLVLLLTGMPLAFVTLLVALIFALGWFGPMAVPLITSRIFSFVNSFVFVSVPMFVLMAAILDRSGIARDLFDAMRVVGGRLRGGVAIQTLLVAVVLAAMSGIIGGEVVLLGLLALPQMLRLGYDQRLAIGVCCAGGALGTMVPPSIVLIIYGLTASVSIGDLFTASFLPGLMLAGFYITYVLIRAYLNPAVAPVPEAGEIPTREKLRLLKGLILPILVVIFVLGSIYGGIASVTEASAIGVIGVTLSTVIRGEFTLALLKGAALQTLSTVGMIVWIGIGASALVGVFNLMGGINFVSSLITGISDNPTVIVLVMMLLLFVLGMFLDWVGIALLTMPIFVPIVRDLGFDPVWFGVVFAMNMQVSFLSPPFGPAAFYLKSVAPAGISLGEIFRSLLPFIAMQMLALALLIAFPGITGR
ncbi:TRAP transporter large permease subunit [Phaeobacter gallaeciensis]|jgi:tripartite ATP-independent transporter DctM subunit|uniref:TRAP transporter large permease protein n=2 Tax=Phaeobacter gallaeciensis TaxID=60890 RepID=A0ABD4XDK2_9RHOB|nr:TRAP transporter large permease subunit [Phaeobacter gallaeciensis]MDE4146517.1 TRAP transporter large permease subunit [Phaeobacter gallaeciensis]MDE4159119.1 TRAP transporter large permease subunit [Phaeobacter gallaeciensis]MDE4163296.1 TRAP transporter large permease subunit [Phaeobacter gallaeciensis]MDE4167597.1 TRAP transporter large permease subunit [Phaeobacter gallaeciensis]MDE4171831.1 TRAP transporter large permease subunit [Phaeobacter gallaeciensis]